MKRLLCASAALLALASPAFGQEMDHGGHGDTIPGMEVDHEGHANHADHNGGADHGAPADPMADMPGMDHSTPTSTSSGASDPHAHHSMGMQGEAEAPTAPPPPDALSGPAHAADTVFPADAMAAARRTMAREMGPMSVATFRLDRLEVQSGKGADGWLWDADLSYGGDIDKLWLKSEGHAAFGHAPEAEAQALWSHAIGPWFDLQAGVRQQIRSGPDRTQAVLGVQGLAPYFFEVDAAAFLSTKGELTGRIEAEYDQRITQRLILQPRAEANLSAQAIPALRLGAGITSVQAGARLRYEIRREFAPYIGIEWQRDLGRTARITRAAGDDAGRILFVAGVRAWF